MENKVDRAIINAISHICDNKEDYKISYDVQKRAEPIRSWLKVTGVSDHIDITINLVRKT
jgi:hypothetical protein